MPRILLVIATALLAGPAAAAPGVRSFCCGAKFAMTFSAAGLEIKAATLVLFGAAAAAAAVWARTLNRLGKASEATERRALAFLEAWRTGGPLLGAASAAYLSMNFFVAVYAYPPVPRYQAYAPGLAEISMVLWAGFAAGAVAALASAHLKGRIGVRR